MVYLNGGTLSSGADFLRRFRPCVVNYIVQFRRSLSSGEYFITPHQGYSARFGAHSEIPYGSAPEEIAKWPDGNWYIGTETECEEKLDRDLSLLASSGYNTLRICGIGPSFVMGEVAYPIVPATEATATEYLNLLSRLLELVASHGMKAILLIGANTDGNSPQWQHGDLYRSFLSTVGSHLAINPTVLAFDLITNPAGCTHRTTISTN